MSLAARRGLLPVLALLALPALLALATAATGADSAATGAGAHSAAAGAGADSACSSLEKAAAEYALKRKGVPARSARVRLLWSCEPARAAAALLRAVLLAAGHRAADVTLQRLPRARTLLEASTDLALKGEVAVAVAVASSEEPYEIEKQGLVVMRAGAAPAWPHLHAHLNATPSRACVNGLPALSRAVLEACGLLTSATTEDENKKNAIVYTLEGEWETETRELKNRVRGGAPLHVRAVSRARLAELVRGPDAFLFLDAELWSGSEQVFPLPADRGARVYKSLFVANRTAILEHAQALKLVIENFTLSTLDLRHILELVGRERSVEEAACKHAPNVSRYAEWLEIARRPCRWKAHVAVCATESHADYEALGKVANNYLVAETKLPQLGVDVLVVVTYVNCNQSSALAVLIGKLQRAYDTWFIIGVAAPAEQALLAAEVAAEALLPLLAYTPAPAAERAHVRSVTGGAEWLAAALRALLAACGWRRLALVSENTPLARAISEALATNGSLTKDEADAADPKAFEKLRKCNTFFVNCDAEAAKRVLEEAVAAGAAGAGALWIVRDYGAPDAAARALAPLLLSLERRGAGPVPARGEAQRRLEAAWPAGVWPRHAASIFDALITIGEGFERLITEHNETLDYHSTREKVSYFWEGVQSRNISGVGGELNYDESGVTDSPVYIYRWDNETQWLDTWTDGRAVRCPAGAAQPAHADGCYWPSGEERCELQCGERTVALGVAAAAAALAALGAAAATARRWLAGRDTRLRRATTARLLAQRDAAFADLAPLLVERGALALGDELGAGRYGRVRRGELRAGARRCRVVAVKELRDGASASEESQFLREARLLAALEHEHVVRCEGVCWEGGAPLLLMELAHFGDLQQYLRARRHLAAGDGAAVAAEPAEAAAVSAEALTRLAREAAEALAYLSARGLVHRDVRAANCLVDGRRSLKLADFGLARETGATDGEYACRGRALFPVLWMAPESLARGVATAASDAWSFGVLALELVTLGARPFGGAAPEAAVRAVLAGGRPPLPRDAAAETRALALACWRREPASRPPAARLAAWLAHRLSALRPALAPDLEELDCDSGIGEPPRPCRSRSRSREDLEPDTRRSISPLPIRRT